MHRVFVTLSQGGDRRRGLGRLDEESAKQRAVEGGVRTEGEALLEMAEAE